MSSTESLDWGLPASEIPPWLRTLDWVRQRVGYRLRLGSRLYGAASARLPRTIDTRLFNDVAVRVDLRQEVARSTWWAGQGYESPTPKVIRLWLARGASQFFDVGANCGYFSYLAHHFSTAHVHLFEPREDLYRQLLAAKSANHLQRFHPYLLGLGDEENLLRLHMADVDTGYSSFGPHPDLLRETEPVRVLPFDQWRREEALGLPGRPQWVAKIDVEGFEAKVLGGMRESLRSTAFIGLVVELNPFTLQFCGSSVEEVVSLLQDSGYTMARERGDEAGLNRFFVPR